MTNSSQDSEQHAIIEEALTLAIKAFHKGNYSEASLLCKEILRLSPEHLEAINLLGLIFLNLGHYQQAISFFSTALAIDPKETGPYINLGTTYKQLGDFEKALSSFETAIKIDPGQLAALNNLGNLYVQLGDTRKANEVFSALIKNDPNHIDGNYNYAILLGSLGKYHAAIKGYHKVLEILPGHREALLNLANAFKTLGLLDKALRTYREGIEKFPKDLTFVSNYLVTLCYLPGKNDIEILNEHLKFGKLLFALQIQGRVKGAKAPYRIAYMSPDFRQHPVYYFISAIIKKHNRKQFEVFCYSDAIRADSSTKKMQDYADQWRDIQGKSDDEVYSLLQTDKIDILIELAGHTGGNRLSLLARKPVCVQATYLGYPGTTGLAAVDYCITDQILTPAGKSQEFYTECLCNLPGSFFSYTPPSCAPLEGPLPAKKKGFITFGAFHNLTKVSDEVIHLWCRILQNIPQSRLLWQAKAFAEKETQDSVLKTFNQYGVTSPRIELLEETSLEEHLLLHNLVDLSLDTFPWNGHTTTCHSLWMGVPTITLAGENQRSRLGMTTLIHAGLPELVSHHPEEYIEKNTNLANDLKRLENYRHHLRKTLLASQMMNYRECVDNLEEMYRTWLG